VPPFRLRLLAAGLQDPLAAADRGLMFLHEQGAIVLQRGLAVFRQAMTLRVLPEARGKRYTKANYQPLAHHYGERTFQVHVMNEYARLGLQTLHPLPATESEARAGSPR
jgi:ATP-dependent DNA helicase RecQ